MTLYMSVEKGQERKDISNNEANSVSGTQLETELTHVTQKEQHIKAEDGV